jgi:hypothetical protein
MRTSDLLPLGAKIASTLKGAADHYATLTGVSPEARRPALVLWVSSQLEDWNPRVRGVTVLDGLTRAAAAEFIGGIAFTICDELKGRGAA